MSLLDWVMTKKRKQEEIDAEKKWLEMVFGFAYKKKKKDEQKD